jgi:hypothetical protein
MTLNRQYLSQRHPVQIFFSGFHSLPQQLQGWATPTNGARGSAGAGVSQRCLASPAARDNPSEAPRSSTPAKS